MDSEQHELTIAAEVHAITELREQWGPLLMSWDPECGEMLILALCESCINIVKHRSKLIGDGQIRLTAEKSAEVIRLSIGDFCRKSDLPQIRPRALDDIRPGGLGTHFVSEIMSRVRYEPNPSRPDCMTLVMEKSLSCK